MDYKITSLQRKKELKRRRRVENGTFIRSCVFAKKNQKKASCLREAALYIPRDDSAAVIIVDASPTSV